MFMSGILHFQQTRFLLSFSPTAVEFFDVKPVAVGWSTPVAGAETWKLVRVGLKGGTSREVVVEVSK